MTNSEIKKDLLSQLLYEAEAYKKFEDIERLVESGMDLSMVPVQPLYVALQNTSSDQVAHILPKLSQEQRQALRDIDLWKKDEVDPESVTYWIDVYSKSTDEKIIQEFVRSEDFLLMLKNQFTIYTFDVEDPEYPEHDNYFLTEDNLLLIEYPENFQLVQELKNLIRQLYAELGVENAYSFLFKMVADSYLIMEEENYTQKNDRLRDFGFVDYYEALEFGATFQKEAEIDAFIRNKKPSTGAVDSIAANQNLHASALTPYQSGMDGLKTALENVKDEKRQQFLHFNFVRLVNGRMSLEDAVKNGSVTMNRVGTQARQCLELGFEYATQKMAEDKREHFFDTFDFVDIFKIGHSLIEMNKKKMKKALAATPFEVDELSFFLGMYWNAFLENSMEEVAKFKFDGSSKPLEIRDYNSYRLWSDATETFVTALPYVHTFFKSIDKLKTDGVLNDQFYMNYQVENIDFEAIMISSFINFVGGFYNEATAGKMGVTISELKDFYHLFFKKKDSEYLIKGEEDPILREKTLDFIRKFGLDQIPRFDKYLYQIMIEQLNGYEVDNMDEEEFKHIGGPILLNNIRN